VRERAVVGLARANLDQRYAHIPALKRATHELQKRPWSVLVRRPHKGKPTLTTDAMSVKEFAKSAKDSARELVNNHRKIE